MSANQYLLNMYAAQTKVEVYKFIRMPVYTITLLIIPLLFYLSTGVSERTPKIIEGVATPIYQLATLGTFAAFGIALFGFGVGVAVERGQGWYHTLRPAPISPMVPLMGKLMGCLLLMVTAMLLLTLEAKLLFQVNLSTGKILLLLFTLVICSVPLASIGLALGSLLGPNSAPIVMMLIYLFVSSVSGIVVPMQMIEKGNPRLAELAPLWPTYHAGQLALSVVRPVAASTVITHVVVLIAITIIAFSLSIWIFRRNAGKVLG